MIESLMDSYLLILAMVFSLLIVKELLTVIKIRKNVYKKRDLLKKFQQRVFNKHSHVRKGLSLVPYVEHSKIAA